jgi:hypothetical protein
MNAEYKCNRCYNKVSVCDHCANDSSEIAPIDKFEGEDNIEILCFNDGEMHFHDERCRDEYMDEWTELGKLVD